MKDNTNIKRIIAGLLAVTISAGATGSIAYAKSSGRASAKAEQPSADNKSVPASRRAAQGSASKDETVYVLCNGDSSVKKVIVSDWLKNTGALTDLSDISSLTGIVNVKGEEQFSQSGDELDWDAEGSDIYYRGTSDRELPVDVVMTYFLDGREVSLEELAGKSGHVTIRWRYINRSKVTKDIDGKAVSIYVPFMAASAAVFDSGSFLNAEVKNGRLISDGGRLIAVGVGFPGLAQSLDLDSVEGLDIDIPDSFEISGDVTDFRMNTSVTVVSDQLFADSSISDDMDVSGITEKLRELADGADKLADGTAKLFDGITELDEKSGALVDGIDRLADGSAQLSGGAKELSDGALALTDGAEKLSGGAASLGSGLASAKAGSSQLADGIDKAGEGVKAVSGGISQVRDGAEALRGGLGSAKEGSAQLRGGLGQLAEGAGTVAEGAKKLDSGAAALTDGLFSAKEGSAKLSAGLGSLGEGAGKLSEGAEKLSDGAASLSSGIGSAKEGSEKLSAGLGSASDGAAKLKTGAGSLTEGKTYLASG